MPASTSVPAASRATRSCQSEEDITPEKLAPHLVMGDAGAVHRAPRVAGARSCGVDYFRSAAGSPPARRSRPTREQIPRSARRSSSRSTEVPGPGPPGDPRRLPLVSQVEAARHVAPRARPRGSGTRRCRARAGAGTAARERRSTHASQWSHQLASWSFERRSHSSGSAGVERRGAIAGRAAAGRAQDRLQVTAVDEHEGRARADHRRGLVAAWRHAVRLSVRPAIRYAGMLDRVQVDGVPSTSASPAWSAGSRASAPSGRTTSPAGRFVVSSDQ